MRIARLGVVALMLLSLACVAQAQETTSVTTTGSATLYVMPDRAVVLIGMVSKDKDLDKARADNQDRAVRVLKALKAVGIEDADIETQSMWVTPWGGGGLFGYRSWFDTDKEIYVLTRSYQVTLKDLTVIDKLVDAALRNGANEMPSVSFETTEALRYKQQARQAAVRQAKEKAVLMAKELGAEVGKPLKIVEGSSHWGVAYGGTAGSTNEPPPEPDVPETTRPGKVAVSASVTVVFELK